MCHAPWTGHHWFWFLGRDGFVISKDECPRVAPRDALFASRPSGPRVQGTPLGASGSGSGQSHLGCARETSAHKHESESR
jgi:hypothetical protein